MRSSHLAAGVFARTTGYLTHQRRHVKLQSLPWHMFTSFADGRISIEGVIDQQSLDKIIDLNGNAIHTTQPVVETLLRERRCDDADRQVRNVVRWLRTRQGDGEGNGEQQST